MAYAHASGRTVDDTVAARALVKQGFKAVRGQCGVPGLAANYGVASGGGTYEPAQRGTKPAEEGWSTEKYLNFAPTLFARLRQVRGGEGRGERETLA